MPRKRVVRQQGESVVGNTDDGPWTGSSQRSRRLGCRARPARARPGPLGHDGRARARRSRLACRASGKRSRAMRARGERSGKAGVGTGCGPPPDPGIEMPGTRKSCERIVWDGSVSEVSAESGHVESRAPVRRGHASRGLRLAATRGAAPAAARSASPPASPPPASGMVWLLALLGLVLAIAAGLWYSHLGGGAPSQLTVPNVVGVKEGAAIRRLRDAGARRPLGRDARPGEDRLRVPPAASSRRDAAARGTTVTLDVASGNVAPARALEVEQLLVDGERTPRRPGGAAGRAVPPSTRARTRLPCRPRLSAYSRSTRRSTASCQTFADTHKSPRARRGRSRGARPRLRREAQLPARRLRPDGLRPTARPQEVEMPVPAETCACRGISIGGRRRRAAPAAPAAAIPMMPATTKASSVPPRAQSQPARSPATGPVPLNA